MALKKLLIIIILGLVFILTDCLAKLIEHLVSSYSRGEVDAPAAALPRLFLRS